MNKRTSLVLILILALHVSGLAQTPAPTPATTKPQQERIAGDDDEDVVRITTNLVQVDAVITDKKGNLVTDLRPDEIELFENGRKQEITNFSFISTESATAQPSAVKSDKPVDKTAPIPPVNLRPEQVRRTVALVVDDLGLSFESTHFVREALKKFVDKQVQPGDLVAIIRTAGGMGALQQFTSDKRQLMAMIERVKWNPNGRGGIWAVAPLEGSVPKASDAGGVGADDVGIVKGDDDDEFREDLFSAGTLGAVNYVVRGMRELPGRKSIVLMSDGISISYKGDPSRRNRMLERLRRLTDLANRASVVIYTMDARGLPTFGLTAADDTSGFNPAQLETQMQSRRDDFFDSQGGLNYLAQQTGGFFVRNDNDMNAGIKRVLDDQKGYYLIGYRPDASTFDPRTGRRQFHKLEIKLKRPNLSHRIRTGFYGISEERATAQRHTRVEQLNSALVSPFTSGGVRLRLTSLYGNDPKVGGFLRSLLHIEARDLTFTAEPDGWHKAVFDVMAVTFGDNGMVVDAVNRIQTVRVRGETYKRVLADGFVYTLIIPVKKPGAYQLRAALRDTATERIGSASQFIEVPNIGKNRLALSGIAVVGTDPAAKPAAINQAAASQTSSATGTTDEEITDIDPQASPAVRRFRRGMVMSFGYFIYNAQLEKGSAQPRLQTQMRLFREGKEIFAGRVQPLDTSGQTDLKRLTAGGALQLGMEMPPGEYILQVIVTDTLAKGKNRVASQWIDFQIVK